MEARSFNKAHMTCHLGRTEAFHLRIDRSGGQVLTSENDLRIRASKHLKATWTLK